MERIEIMNDQEITNKINHFFVEYFEVPEEKLLPEANQKDTLDLDSLDYNGFGR
jgi:hypothetical protein